MLLIKNTCTEFTNRFYPRTISPSHH